MLLVCFFWIHLYYLEGPFTKDRSRSHDIGFTTGHVFPFYVLVLFRSWGLLDWVDHAFLGGAQIVSKKQRWSLGYGGREFDVLNLGPEPRCLFATRGREEPKHQQQQHEYTMGGHTCRNIADLACF